MKDGGEQRKKEALSESAVYDEWRIYVSLIITIIFCIVNTYVSRYPQMHEGAAKKKLILEYYYQKLFGISTLLHLP